MKYDFNLIQEKIQLVKEEMFKRFPKCSHTVTILLWDDGDFHVECRHGNDECSMIYHSKYHYFTDKLSFEEEILKGEYMIVDKEGKETLMKLVKA